MTRNTNHSSQLVKLLASLVSTPTRLGNSLIIARYNAIKHLPDKENIIARVWKSSVILYYLLLRSPSMRKLIISTHASHLRNKWTTFLDKLSICSSEDLNILPMYLLQTLLLESISREKVYSPYWTPAYNELSENLLLPIEIDYVGLVSSLSSPLSRRAEEKLPLLTMKPIKVQNKNSLRTYFPLSTYTAANKWVNEATPTGLLKSLKIKLKPSQKQMKMIDEWLNTSNYVYNKTVEQIYKHNHKADFKSLRDMLVTENTKKTHVECQVISKRIIALSKEKHKVAKESGDDATEIIKELETLVETEKETLKNVRKTLPFTRNNAIQEWELNTPKDIRAGAVEDACKAIKSGIANLNAGNIRHFHLGFRKKKDTNKCMVLPKMIVRNNNGIIRIAPDYLKEHCNFKMGNRTKKKYENLVINNDCRLVKEQHSYWLIVPIPALMTEKTTPVNYCGVDPGVRTFMTSFGNHGCLEYKHNEAIIKKIDAKIKSIKNERIRKADQVKTTKRIYKYKITKLEERKANLINELHWKTIRHLLETNDFIFYGNIKSHGIVKNGKNRTLNTDVNNLKFYQFKQRLLFKATEMGKKVILVNEAYTTQTCSFCGDHHKVGALVVYSCKKCQRKIGRDVNAAKNILMKGIQENIQSC